MTIIPRNNQILVEKEINESKTSENGIYIPDNEEKEQKAVGIVKAISPKITDIQIGEKVIFGAYAGETIDFKENGKDIKYVLLFDEDVLAIIKE